MTSTPKAPGQGVPDDHEPDGTWPETSDPEREQEAAAPDSEGDAVVDGDAGPDTDAGPDVDADAGSDGGAQAEAGTDAGGEGEDDRAAETEAETQADDVEPEPADEPEPEPADEPESAAGADAVSGAGGDPGTAAGGGAGNDDGHAGPGSEGEARTQPDLGGPQAEPERHGGHVVLGGRYELGDVLGTGATFTVYEARSIGETDAPDSWPLVVKVLHPHLVDDEFSRSALRREVAASERIDHPGVVKVLATGEDDVAGAVVPWTVMRRFPGALLSDAAAGGGLPWQFALEAVADLLDGLAAVHDAGFVHRDIAPRNVMMDRREDGTYGVGLLDLGLTAAAGGPGDGETVSGSIIGMSPEQAKGQPLDARSDLYAVGALTYYAITGHAPFERAAAQDVLRAHVEAPVPAVSARKPAVPGPVDRIVARAMAKNSLRRYPDAAAMAAALRALLAELGGSGGAAVAAVPSGDPTLDLAQIGSDPTEKLDQVGGGTLKVGQLSDEVAGESRTTVVGAYVPRGGVASTEVLPPAARGAAAGGRPPLGPPPLADPAEEQPVRRGRVVALVVALVLVLGGGGLALAGVLTNGWARDPAAAITRDASKRPKPEPSATPSESATEPAVPYVPEPDPEPSEPSPSATPSASPSATPSDATEEPTDAPTDEPSDAPTGDPSGEPTGDPSGDPTGGVIDPPGTDPPPPSEGDTGDGGAADGGTGAAADAGSA
ncbi:serine/threonine-protein kinase [Myceligenerans indicum]|uniref:non-specific serine/threonine protein kinase n=1 Tax=Myceligenerans indicum TaxID=2593663 RepID=A0ABS1LGV9_9MICO|nr:serine/threonine-protein kinase [Myceligenerans indicum]MBL0885394.1 protein kinase [Myceligenerans indicum]